MPVVDEYGVKLDMKKKHNVLVTNIHRKKTIEMYNMKHRLVRNSQPPDVVLRHLGTWHFCLNPKFS